MKISVKLSLAFATLVLPVLVVVTLTLYGLAQTNHQIERVIEHDAPVIANSHKLMKLIVDMETGQRGFVITGRDEFLKPYHEAKTKIDNLLEIQLELSKDSPYQIAHLQNIRTLINVWQEKAALPEIDVRREVARREVHAARMQALVMSAHGKKVFDEMRNTIVPMLKSFEIDGNLAAVHSLSRFEKAMVDCETGKRGFLLTGKEVFLEPYHAGKKVAEQSLKELHDILETAHDRQAISEDVQKIKSLFMRWTADNLPASEILDDNPYKQMLNMLNTLAKRFTAANNITLIDASTMALTKLTIVRDQKLDQKKHQVKTDTYNKAEQDFLASVQRIANVNANAYDIKKMTHALKNLEAIAQRWLNESAKPEIQARRDMNQYPQTLATLSQTLAQGTGKQIFERIRIEHDSFVAKEIKRLAARETASRKTLALIRNSALISSAVAILVAGFLAWFFRRLLMKPITELMNGLNAISKGDRDKQIQIHAKDEMGNLATAFNHMSKELKSLETKQALTTKELLQAKEDAEHASRAKGDFLANMSHEIRTPMTAILGYADLLNEENDPKIAKNAIRTIQANAGHLLTVINDILDVSKIEAGQMVVEAIDFSPVQLVEEVVSLVGPRANGKGIGLGVRYENVMPKTITSDSTRLRQILLNLVGNAVKFTEMGSVKIHVNCDWEKEYLAFRVIDTGIGMSPQQRDCIARFDAFTQADSTTTRKFGGTGLGLRISNALAKMLGGDIQIESKQGEGSTFSVTIKTGQLENIAGIEPERIPSHEELRKIDQDASQATEKNKSLQGVRVLLAEDGPDNQRLISFHLKRAGAEIHICENGLIAVTMLEDTQKNQWPDVVLMDMQMPELDGYGATRRLRENGFTLPIIALTAHAMEGDRQKCLDAGCDDYLTKPINKVELINICLKHHEAQRLKAA